MKGIIFGNCVCFYILSIYFRVSKILFYNFSAQQCYYFEHQDIFTCIFGWWNLQFQRDFPVFHRCWWVCRGCQPVWKWAVPECPWHLSLWVWDGVHSCLWQQILPRWGAAAAASALFSELGLAALKQGTSNRTSAWSRRESTTCFTHKKFLKCELCWKVAFIFFMMFSWLSSINPRVEVCLSNLVNFFFNSFLSLLDSVWKILCYLYSPVQLLFPIMFLHFLLLLLFNMTV